MTISSRLQVLPAATGTAATAEPVFRLLNRTVYFNGDCERCRPHCAALCCTGYGFVSLSEEEAKSGRYRHKQATAGCDCAMCQRMREAGVEYTLLKQADGSCTYLDGTRRCSIYDDRPETCRKYDCRNIPFRLSVP